MYLEYGQWNLVLSLRDGTGRPRSVTTGELLRKKFIMKSIMKCPKKHVKNCVFTSWHMHFLNTPKSKNFIFGSFSALKFYHVFQISESDRKNGAFRKSTWSISKKKRNRKWNSSILGHLEKTQYSTCFFRHFILPPV